MTRRAFDTRGNLADQLFRCLETPYSDVLEHNAVPATKSPGQRIFLWPGFVSSNIPRAQLQEPGEMISTVAQSGRSCLVDAVGADAVVGVDAGCWAMRGS